MADNPVTETINEAEAIPGEQLGIPTKVGLPASEPHPVYVVPQSVLARVVPVAQGGIVNPTPVQHPGYSPSGHAITIEQPMAVPIPAPAITALDKPNLAVTPASDIMSTLDPQIAQAESQDKGAFSNADVQHGTGEHADAMPAPTSQPKIRFGKLVPVGVAKAAAGLFSRNTASQSEIVAIPPLVKPVEPEVLHTPIMVPAEPKPVLVPAFQPSGESTTVEPGESPLHVVLRVSPDLQNDTKTGLDITKIDELLRRTAKSMMHPENRSRAEVASERDEKFYKAADSLLAGESRTLEPYELVKLFSELGSWQFDLKPGDPYVVVR